MLLILNFLKAVSLEICTKLEIYSERMVSVDFRVRMTIRHHDVELVFVLSSANAGKVVHVLIVILVDIEPTNLESYSLVESGQGSEHEARIDSLR